MKIFVIRVKNHQITLFCFQSDSTFQPFFVCILMYTSSQTRKCKLSMSNQNVCSTYICLAFFNTLSLILEDTYQLITFSEENREVEILFLKALHPVIHHLLRDAKFNRLIYLCNMSILSFEILISENFLFDSSFLYYHISLYSFRGDRFYSGTKML